MLLFMLNLFLEEMKADDLEIRASAIFMAVRDEKAEMMALAEVGDTLDVLAVRVLGEVRAVVDSVEEDLAVEAAAEDAAAEHVEQVQAEVLAAAVDNRALAEDLLADEDN